MTSSLADPVGSSDSWMAAWTPGWGRARAAGRDILCDFKKHLTVILPEFHAWDGERAVMTASTRSHGRREGMTSGVWRGGVRAIAIQRRSRLRYSEINESIGFGGEKEVERRSAIRRVGPTSAGSPRA